MVKGVISLPDLQVEVIAFSPAVAPPGSSTRLFLAGSGERGFEINGQFIVFTAIGVYLEEEAVPALAPRWKGKTAEELGRDCDFFRDIFTGSFEKVTRITMVKPLTGKMYSENVTKNWATGVYTDAEGAAVEQFKAAFAAETFPPGSSILFAHHRVLEGGIDDAAAASAVIENRALSEAVLESIIGEHGVSPATKRSVALRMSELLKEVAAEQPEEGKTVNPVFVSV